LKNLDLYDKMPVLQVNDPKGNLQRTWGRVVGPTDALNIDAIPLNPAPNSKIIGEYVFTPLGITELDGDHEGILYTSRRVARTELTHYTAYRSISSGGMWHLYIRSMDGPTFYKGKDYVQSTLLHIELQIYFSDWFSYPGRNAEEFLPIVGDAAVNDWLESMQVADDDARILNNLKPCPPNVLPFKEYNEKNKCGKPYNKYKDLLTFSERLEETFPLSKLQFNPLAKNYVYETESDKVDEQLTIVGDFYSVKLDKEIIIYFLKYKADIVVNDLGQTYTKDLKTAKIGTKTYAIDISRVYDDKLFDMFKDDETLAPYIEYTRVLRFLNGDSRELLQDELITRIQKNPKKYTDYLTELHKTSVHQFGTTSYKFTPVCITTVSNRILKQGLNSHFISAGDYICKLFDYVTQMPSYAEQRYKFTPHKEFPKPISFGRYFYLGWKYDEVYPFNRIDAKMLRVACQIKATTYKRNNLKTRRARFNTCLAEFPYGEEARGQVLRLLRGATRRNVKK
jgi:hypothetical protein